MVVCVLNIHEVLNSVYRGEIYAVFKRDKPLSSDIGIVEACRNVCVNQGGLETSCLWL